jgi:hypothetical protein
VNVNHYRYPNYVWEPRYRYGGRPVVRGSEGRVYTADRERTPRHGVLDSTATRTREGAVAREGAAPSAAANGTPQPRRGVTSESYRSRNATTTQPQATGTAPANRARSTPNGRTTLAQPPTGRSTQANEGSNGRSTRAQAPPGQTSQPPRNQAREPGDSSGASGAQPSRTYRSGGGMSQALERNRPAAQPSTGARTSPGSERANASVARVNPRVSPRATEGSTGTPPRQQSAPPPRQQSGGNDGGNRGNSGGGNSGGGSYRGGGERSAHGAARTR